VSIVSTRIVRDENELAALEPGWWDLWRKTPEATPFQTPGWLLAWWRHFAPGQLFTLAAERDGRLVGLAPLYLENGTLGRRILPIGISLSDYHDVLLDPAQPADTWHALRGAALSAPDAWERWDWEELMPEATALRLPWPSGCVVETRAQSTCPVLELSSPILEECLPKTKRRKLNMARNRGARRGVIRIGKADSSNIDVAVEHLFRLHSSRWRSRGEDGVLTRDSVLRFHRDAAPALDAAGLLRLYTLAFDDRVVAAYYGFHHGKRAYAYLSGLDPDFEFESPGTLITAHAIGEALREGAREFHFLRGQEDYKYSWGAHDRWNQRRTIERNADADAAA
jgi:CelD/BcsL family acetyltransferase involved in cellulose biosynthesis